MIGDFKPELLAPCGDWEAFLAAVENGANAVYMGGTLFSARQFASNFDKDKLKEAVGYAHVRDVNVYLTMNTLMADSELKEALDFLEEAYLAGIDGVIVQDIGFASAVRKLFPDLPLHASTQMTIYNLEGVRLLEELGFKRVVLARELSMEEIKNIAKNTSLEIEIFIHGALCISYSGQCLMSSIIGGRSGNRGKCAQPCRLPYQFVAADRDNTLKDSIGKAYLLSPKDLCSIEILDEIINTGVKSLKIEGRMKNPEYVATVVKTYRKYLDKVLKDPGSNNYQSGVEKKDLKDLAQIFNRGGLSRGYLEGKTGRDMMSFEKPKNWGTYLGKVVSYDKSTKTAQIKLEDHLAIGDGIEIWNDEDESPGTIVTGIRVKGQEVTEAEGIEMAEVSSIKGRINKGNKVYKTSDKKLNTLARESFTGKFVRKVPIEGKLEIKYGKPLSLIVKDYAGNMAEIKASYTPEKAINRPLTEERVLEQLGKTGQTPFEFREISVDLENGLVVPVSEINTIRRSALERLEMKRADRYPARKIHNSQEKIKDVVYFPGNSRIREKQLKISACFYKEIEGLDYGSLKVDRLYLPFGMLIKENAEKVLRLKGSSELFVYIPSITRGNYDRLIRSKLKDVVEMGVDGILVGNPGSFDYGRRFPGLKIMGDHPLNIFNSTSIKDLKELGFDGVTLSLELNLNQIKDLEQFPGLIREVLVYGRIPLMTSEYCPTGSIHGNHSKDSSCSHGCSGRDFRLKDRMNMEFPVLCDRIDCRSTIFNANVLLAADSIDKIKTSGADMVRLNFIDERPDEIRSIVDMHRDVLNYGKKALDAHKQLTEKIKDRGFTKGHYLRGV